MTQDERQDAWASLQMISETIETLFGVKASLESEEGTLHRGPEYCHRAEGIIEALQRLALKSAPVDGYALGLKDAARMMCVECGKEPDLYYLEFQEDPEPAFWHGNKACGANKIHLAIRSRAAAPTTAKDDEGHQVNLSISEM